jgi:peptidyl-tRNA hydrolase, PTH1 family
MSKIFMKFFKRRSSNKILIFGLGNPGDKYKKTRHNIGKIILENLGNQHGDNFIKKIKFSADISEGMLNNKEVFFAYSHTFMNESGRAVVAVSKYYKISPENIWIVHDDIDIALGKIKISKNQGSAGHNGVKSIRSHLGNNNFNRLRVGIWGKDFSEKSKEVTQNYVLEKFIPEEQEKLKKIIEDAISILISSV